MLTVIGLPTVPTSPLTASKRIVFMAVNVKGPPAPLLMPDPETMLIESLVNGPDKTTGVPVTERSVNVTGASPTVTMPIPAAIKRCGVVEAAAVAT
jgi:hypothetical protein